MPFENQISGLTEIWQHRRHIVYFLLLACVIFAIYSLFTDDPAEFFAYLIGGSVIIWLTNRRAKAMEDSVRMAERGQAISRFESALKLLENENAPVIVGAVYALHWMAREEAEYRGPVFDVLCELIRESGDGSKINAKKIAAKLLFKVDGNEPKRIYQNDANLEGANLSGWDLSKMKLVSANLCEADLSGANIKGVDMTGANLSRAKIDRIQTNNETKMCGALLQGIQVSSMELQGVDFSGADMRAKSGNPTSFTHVNFPDCNFDGAQLDKVWFKNSDFSNAKNLTANQLIKASSLQGVRGLPEEIKKEIEENRPELFEQESDN